MSEVEDRVKQVLGRLLGVNHSDLRNEAALVRDLGADSSHGVELVLQLEDALEIRIANDTRRELVTVADVVAFAQEQFSQQHRAVL